MLLQLVSYLQSRIDNEDGATMVEYGIMVAVIALVAIAGAALLGGGIDALFQDANGRL